MPRVCTEPASTPTGRHLCPPTLRDPHRADTASVNTTAQPSQLDSAKLLQTLLLVQQEFQAEQAQLQQQLAHLTQQLKAKDTQLAQLHTSLDGATQACHSKDECMREMERERVEWLDVLMCVKQMHSEMVDKMGAMKQRKVKRLMDVAKGRARVA